MDSIFFTTLESVAIILGARSMAIGRRNDFVSPIFLSLSTSLRTVLI